MKVGVVGASGYVGGETLRLLVNHPEVEISMVTSRQHVGEYLHRIQPSLKGFTDLTFSELDYEKLTDQCDVVFTAVPHGTATEIVKAIRSEVSSNFIVGLRFSQWKQQDYENGMVGNIHIQIIYQNQFLEFQNYTEKKLKKHSLFLVQDVWQLLQC